MRTLLIAGLLFSAVLLAQRPDPRLGAGAGARRPIARPSTPPVVAPTRPVVTDARLGAGGPSTGGNILSPGTPGRTADQRSGDVISPGLPGSRSQGDLLNPGTSDRSRPRSRGAVGDDERRASSALRALPVANLVAVPYPIAYPVEAVAPDEPNAAEPNEVLVDRGAADGVVIVGPPPLVRGLAGEDDADVDEAKLRLIALEGGLVYAAQEYWLEGDALHYVTARGDEYVVSVVEVDFDESSRLNRERGQKLVLEVR